MKRRTASRGFTLVELLTVIGIIAVLAGILIPTVNVAIRKAKVAKAQQEVEAIALAAKAYHDEYGRWPAHPANSSKDPPWTAWAFSEGKHAFNNLTLATNVNVLLTQILTGQPRQNGQPNEYNPKMLEFLTVKAQSRQKLETNVRGAEIDWFFADPWGRPYFIAVDDDYQYDHNKNPNRQSPPFHNISGVDVYSAGPDADLLDDYRYEDAGTYDGAINNW